VRVGKRGRIDRYSAQFSYPDLTDSSSDRSGPGYCLDPTAMAQLKAIFPRKVFALPALSVILFRGADRCPRLTHCAARKASGSLVFES